MARDIDWRVCRQSCGFHGQQGSWPWYDHTRFRRHCNRQHGRSNSGRIPDAPPRRQSRSAGTTGRCTQIRDCRATGERGRRQHRHGQPHGWRYCDARCGGHHRAHVVGWRCRWHTRRRAIHPQLLAVSATRHEAQCHCGGRGVVGATRRSWLNRIWQRTSSGRAGAVVDSDLCAFHCVGRLSLWHLGCLMHVIGHCADCRLRNNKRHRAIFTRGSQ